MSARQQCAAGRGAPAWLQAACSQLVPVPGRDNPKFTRRAADPLPPLPGALNEAEVRAYVSRKKDECARLFFTQTGLLTPASYKHGLQRLLTGILQESGMRRGMGTVRELEEMMPGLDLPEQVKFKRFSAPRPARAARAGRFEFPPSPALPPPSSSVWPIP